jgi:hypothetical protein
MALIRILRTVVIAAWVLIGALFFAATVLYAGLFFSLHPTPWNFPGDPPLFDLLIYAAGIATVINVPAWLLVSRFAGREDFLLLCRDYVQS